MGVGVSLLRRTCLVGTYEANEVTLLSLSLHMIECAMKRCVEGEGGSREINKSMFSTDYEGYDRLEGVMSIQNALLG